MSSSTVRATQPQRAAAATVLSFSNMVAPTPVTQGASGIEPGNSATARRRASDRSRPMIATHRLDGEVDGPVPSVTSAMTALAAGRSIVLIDPQLPEHPGYLVAAAALVTAPHIAFIVRHSSGVLCVPMTGPDCDRLDLPLMVQHNDNPAGTAFTVTVDAAAGITTGISAADRATTIRLLADPAASPEDFCRPGHVLPQRARPGGVLQRARHTEAAVDLTRLSGAGNASVLAAIVNDDSTIVTAADARRFAEQHNLRAVTIPALVRYRQLSGTIDAPVS